MKYLLWDVVVTTFLLLFFYEQNSSQNFPPALTLLEKKDRTEAEEGLQVDAG